MTHQASHPNAPRADAGKVIEVELAQGLGLPEALSIGVGTMIGAGIFVLPGFIIAKAGPAAVLAFLLGGIVALFCAMSAAEVATGMPKSGGGYYFISRALGPLWGAIIGWGSWFGLIFATAFYAVGFGEYVHAFTGIPMLALAIGMTIILVGLNLIGSKAAGQAQNLIVAVLAGVMVLFIGRAVFDVDPALLGSGSSDPSATWAEGFMPFGVGAVAAGTATLFVTYCGFGEIASMAEEIKNPGRNLPIALLGSVLIVTVLYCVVLLLCVTLRPYDELGGATIVADLAGDLMGGWGRGAVLVGAVMATVSSANASIMSASRISFAMGRDRLVSEWLSQVHPRFRVPHRAVLVSGLLICAVIALGDIELLAEAAGLLHLLMYGLICLACIVLRGARPLAYRPAYRVPLYPYVPILGALGCLGVSFFMAPTIVLMGLGIIVLASAHYFVRGRRRTEVRGAWPYFLRRGLLEPALERVERWGAPDELPTAVVAVAHPEREMPRLRVAAALMGPSKGRVLAVSAFLVRPGEVVDDELMDLYHGTLERRRASLREMIEPIGRAGAQVSSVVPMAASPLQALVSTVAASHATLLLLGWPEPAKEGETYRLVGRLARYARAHLLVLREHGPVPPRRIAVFAGEGTDGNLALLLASRLSSAWDVPLTVAAVVPESATAADAQRAETALEERVSDTVRAEYRVVQARSKVAAAATAARKWQMVVLGIPRGGSLLEVMTELEPVRDCSLVLVRAHEAHPIEVWM